MSAAPTEVTLQLCPKARLDIIDVKREILGRHGDLLGAYPRTLYFSYHTTAGYLEQRLIARLSRGRSGVEPYLELFQTLFPAGGGYQHDQLHLREELSEEQRLHEPLNADSHLAYITAGLKSCVTYANKPDQPVYFIDLDGKHGDRCRQRTTSVIGYHKERVVSHARLEVPVSHHPIDSVNLKDPRIGLLPRLQELVERHGVAKGRILLALSPGESHAGLTVNEYETLLMKHDLAEVLHDPLRFLGEKWRNMVADPRAIPHKTLEYAKYDLVRVLNRLMDALGVSESVVEKVLARVMAYPADRFLRLKRSLSLLVSNGNGHGEAAIVHGPYQSPILVQWGKAARQVRRVDATLTSLM